ncbi:MAG: saccharopine dehydrogenase family protein [Candidatus Heimdallarchaeota archaeon]
MRILLLGAAGKIGSALLKDLIRSVAVSEIIADDLNIKRLKRVVQDLESEKIQTTQMNVTDGKKLTELMQDGFDSITSAIPGEYQYTAISVAIEAGVSFVDVGVDSPEVFYLNEAAKAADITVVPNLGLDPGIDRVCQSYAISQLDKVKALRLYCGGIPQRPQKNDNPLGYKISWAWYHTIGTYLGKARLIRNGEIVEVDKFGPPENLELVRFPEPIGECEAFFSGASFDLIDQLNLKDLSEAWNKSVRWRGHCEIWQKLIALHLIDFEPLQINMRIRSPPVGSHVFDIEYLDRPIEISPFEFLNALGEKYLQYKPGEGDAVVLRTEVIGEKNGKQIAIGHELIDFYDPELNITSMGRTTAYPTSIVSQMIVRGDLKERGVVHCGKIGMNPQTAKIFFAELAKRNIIIKETVSKTL